MTSAPNRSIITDHRARLHGAAARQGASTATDPGAVERRSLDATRLGEVRGVPMQFTVYGMSALTVCIAPSRAVRTFICRTPLDGTVEMIHVRLPCCWVR